MRLPITLFVCGLGLLGCGDQPSIEVEVLSSRADMATGGDALVEIRGADPESLRVLLNEKDISGAFRSGEQHSVYTGLISGLEIGENSLEVQAAGQTARLTIVNFTGAGPVFSGPHQQPFVCETESAGLGPPLDVDCGAETRTAYYYLSNATDEADGSEDRNAAPAAFKPFDPAAPRPPDMAQTTTIPGKTVDFIVRHETGTINRAVYQFAVLHDPSAGDSAPAIPNAAWNRRLVYRFGGGCGAGYRQAGMPSVLRSVEILGQGYAVAGSSLNIFGNNCNDVLSAETMMMVKERFIETSGLPDYTIGVGGSGGSMQQHLIAQNYPGLLDGIIPGASYPDLVTIIGPVTDCSLLARAFEANPSWTDEQKTAVSGYAAWKTCESWMRSFSPGWLEPKNCAEAAPDGVRCGIHDNMVNLVGRDPATGQARRFLDNVGVEYGRNAFEASLISAEQFVALNEGVGGYDADASFIPQRTVADPETLQAVYAGGRVNAAAGSLGSIPILDTRRYLDPTGDIHDRVRTFTMGARLSRAHGAVGNRVTLTNRPAELDEVLLMDRWLDKIGKDALGNDAPEGALAQAVARAKPVELADSCWSDEGERIADGGESRCSELYPPHSDPRLAAGAPSTNDILKCALKPLRGEDYRRALSADQIERLQAVFPDGVCDYSQPGVGQQPPTGTWQRY